MSNAKLLYWFSCYSQSGAASSGYWKDYSWRHFPFFSLQLWCVVVDGDSKKLIVLCSWEAIVNWFAWLQTKTRPLNLNFNLPSMEQKLQENQSQPLCRGCFNYNVRAGLISIWSRVQMSWLLLCFTGVSDPQVFFLLLEQNILERQSFTLVILQSTKCPSELSVCTLVLAFPAEKCQVIEQFYPILFCFIVFTSTKVSVFFRWGKLIH